MRTRGGWLVVLLAAVLLTACSASSSTPTPVVTPASVTPATPASTTRPTPPPTAVPASPAAPAQPPVTSPPAVGGQAVSISNFAFVPATLTVKVGTRVTWTNRQAGIQHTVTANDGSFDSGSLSAGSSFSHVFTKAGTFPYHCAIHPFMTGTVIVTG